MKEIIIPLSKTKLIKQFVFASVFVVLGVLLTQKPQWFIKSDDTSIVTYIGYTILFFAGIAFFFLGQKLFDKKPGMIIDREGITDNSSGMASKIKIIWKDVKAVTVQEVSNQKFIMLKMKNPEFYLEQEKNPIKKRVMELNMRLYQTPICITTIGLKIGVDELYQKIQNYYVGV